MQHQTEEHIIKSENDASQKITTW